MWGFDQTELEKPTREANAREDGKTLVLIIGAKVIIAAALWLTFKPA